MAAVRLAAVPLSGLYVITDRRLSRGRSHEEVVEAALRGGAAIIQLRDKDAPRPELLATAKRLAHLCRQAGALLIVNDDPVLAAEAGADGVHLGPTDPSPSEARAIVGDKAIVGWSTKASVDLAREAVAAGVDYVAVGSIYPTTTKEGAVPVGVDKIRDVRQAVNLPLAAIGGITAANARPAVEAGADMVCVISAVVAAPDVEAACRELVAAIAK
jgi:thiamine-phosphate diphosphorylase